MTNKEFDIIQNKMSKILTELENEGIKKSNILRYIIMNYKNNSDNDFNVTSEMYVRLFRELTSIHGDMQAIIKRIEKAQLDAEEMYINM